MIERHCCKVALAEVRAFMGYSAEQPPPHSHRRPSELAGDEIVPARRASATRTVATSAARFQHLCSGEPFNLLLAIENDNNALAAVRVASALIPRGASPRVLNVTRPLRPPRGSSSAVDYADIGLGADFHSHRCSLLHDLIVDAIGEEQDWPIQSLIGDPATAIVEAAETENAELIVIGINRHSAYEQAIGANTATRIIGKAPVPVLAVRPGMQAMPKLIMVATDFGESSRQAAQIAANFAKPHGRVVLVHVTAPNELLEETADRPPKRNEEVADAFLRLTAGIRQSSTVDVETVHRTGDPLEEILAAAQAIGPDLIAIGSERVDRVTRLPLESLSRPIIRDGHWPMLVTPPLEPVSFG